MEKIICLWSCPRNVSTALMYSFGSREDTSVFDEPLYAHYLKKSKLKHPGREETLKSLECDGEKVIREIILKPKNKINFHKLMTHFLIDIDLDFLKKVTNILFIRDPKEIINSYHKVIPHPSIDDIGIEKQFKLFNYLKSNNQDIVVLDSKELLIDPENTLKKLCKNLTSKIAKFRTIIHSFKKKNATKASIPIFEQKKMVGKEILIAQLNIF